MIAEMSGEPICGVLRRERLAPQSVKLPLLNAIGSISMADEGVKENS